MELQLELFMCGLLDLTCEFVMQGSVFVFSVLVLSVFVLSLHFACC